MAGTRVFRYGFMGTAIGRRFRCTMRIDCGQIDPETVVQHVISEWHPYIPKRLHGEELAESASAVAHEKPRLSGPPVLPRFDRMHQSSG